MRIYTEDEDEISMIRKYFKKYKVKIGIGKRTIINQTKKYIYMSTKVFGYIEIKSYDEFVSLVILDYFNDLYKGKIKKMTSKERNKVFNMN